MAQEFRKVRRRSELSKGDPVNVVVRYGHDGSMLKRKRARVVDVLRKAAILTDIEGEKANRTVPFQELELVVEVPEPAPTPPKKERPKVVAPPPSPSKKEPPKVKTESPPPAVPSDLPPAINEWMTQGIKLQEELIKQAHVIEDEVSELRARQKKLEDEALQVADQANARQRDLDRVREKIAFMDQLRQGIG